MIQGLNDSPEDAGRLIKLVHGIPSKINLIPFNEYTGSTYKRPSDHTVDAFYQYLLKRKVGVIIRKSKGSDISAACGQLAGSA